MISTIHVSRIDWQGVTVEVSYEPSWSPAMDSCYGRQMAHLQLRAVAPEDAMLPVTETGYRSHFVPNAEILDAGGAIAYVRAWLDDAAQLPVWKEAQDRARQLTLF